ncbi:MAG: hypothetical protein L7T24_12100 [Luminiphilus sp.]|nr:hypothetical protein [Luminiphilus sp.]
MKPVLWALLLLAPVTGLARPVSYVGGWTLIEESNRQSTSALVHYTPTPAWSVGLRNEWMRDTDYLLTAIQPTYLLKRWFGRDYQANIYLHGGLGVATATSGNPLGSTAAGFAGVMADWETRRLFAGYNARYLDAGHFGDSAMQVFRFGWAPYEGDTNELHTWLMLEVDQRSGLEDSVSITPLLRFFKGPALLELGFNLTDPSPLINFTFRF